MRKGVYRTMKRPISLVAVFLGAALVTGCAERGELLAGGNPQTSALTMFAYDGSKCTMSLLFDDEQTQQLLDKINALPAIETAAGELSGDIYAFTIGTGESDISGLWQDGIWTAQDGKQYAVSADFAEITAGYDWEESSEVSLYALPNIRALAQSGEGWNTAYLERASEPEQSALSIEITNYDGAALAKITNTSNEEQCYGVSFMIEVCLDGIWYCVPPQNELCFNEIAMIVPAGKTVEESYSVEYYYGELPEGEYRLRTSFGAANL